MKIPDDVKIKVIECARFISTGEAIQCCRSDAEKDLLWTRGHEWTLNNFYCKGLFFRTTKTRRVVWDLPEGFEIPADTKVMLEKFILSISDWQGSRYTPTGWTICSHAGGGEARHAPFRFSMRFRVTESTEVPWSPFDEDKKGTE